MKLMSRMVDQNISLAAMYNEISLQATSPAAIPAVSYDICKLDLFTFLTCYTGVFPFAPVNIPPSADLNLPLLSSVET
jgi:hypothetical protein